MGLSEQIKSFAGGERNIVSAKTGEAGARITVKDRSAVKLDGIRALDAVAKASLSGTVLKCTFIQERGAVMGKYHELAGNILKNVGGIENVKNLKHCITRLRFSLKDESLANDDVIGNLDGVIQVMKAGGQYQVVIGAAVDDVYEELVAEYKVPGMGGVDADDDDQLEENDKKKGPLNALMGTISGVMGPVLMPMAAAGMLKGLAAFFASLGIIGANDGIYQLMYAIGDGFFYFLPIILGYTASKHFHCNELTGMVLGCAYLYPAMVALPSGDAIGTLFGGTAFEMNYYSTLFGLPIIFPLSGYTMSVFPIIISTYFAAKLEKVLRRKLPELIRNFATPVIVFAVMVCAEYVVIGPVASLLTSLITFIVSSVYAIPTIGGPLCCLLIGGSFSTLVMFGLHWAMMPISLNNMATLGFDPLVGSGIGGFVGLGQGLAVALRTKNQRMRGIAIPALVSQFCGVGEPLLYGIQIPSKFLYIQNIVFSAIGGLLCGIFGVKQFINGGMGFFSLPSFVDPATNDAYCMYAYAVILGVLMVASFIFTLATYHDDGCYLGKDRSSAEAE